MTGEFFALLVKICMSKMFGNGVQGTVILRRLLIRGVMFATRMWQLVMITQLSLEQEQSAEAAVVAFSVDDAKLLVATVCTEAQVIAWSTRRRNGFLVGRSGCPLGYSVAWKKKALVKEQSGLPSNFAS